ncbi:hypothetical protein GGI23_000770 [Coemansia sp. RSA 2559]|nr:hypothetical protein GGI23_000770 [Coemansia sp. RSA 2559]KAJ2856510.1 hypothetical protein GGI22_003793 [Coemansia erecta]
MRFLEYKSLAAVLLPPVFVLATLIGAQASVGSADDSPDIRNKGRLSNERIIGGVESTKGEFPSAVSLQIISDAGLGFCGGTLVTTSAVVTAAHCVYDFTSAKPVDAHNIRIGYGSNSRNNQTLVTAQRVDIDPGFNPRETINDIAVITIDPIKLVPGSVDVAPIFSGGQPQGTQLTAVGWGLTTADGSAGGLPDALQKTQIIVGSAANCSKFIPGYKSSDGPQICTENTLRPGTDTCQGDSGTGIYRIVDGKSFLAGLTSYGANLEGDPTCALDDGFAVYTHVSYYRSFIDGVVGEVLRRRQLNKEAAQHVRVRDGTYNPSAGNVYPSSGSSYYPAAANPYPSPGSSYYPSADDSYANGYKDKHTNEHKNNYASGYADEHESGGYDDAVYDDGYSSPSEEPSHRHRHHHGHHHHRHHRGKGEALPTVTVIATKVVPYPTGAPYSTSRW